MGGFCGPFGCRVLIHIFVLDINCQLSGSLYIEGCLCALRAQLLVTYICILILDRICQKFGKTCQLEGFCPRAQLSGAQLSTLKKWTVGPRGPVVQPEKLDSWAPDSWFCPASVRGPTVRGPICLESHKMHLKSWSESESQSVIWCDSFE